MFDPMFVHLRKIPRNRHNKTGKELIDDFADSVESMFKTHERLKDLFTRPIPKTQDKTINIVIPTDTMESGYLTISFSIDGHPLCAYDCGAK